MVNSSKQKEVFTVIDAESKHTLINWDALWQYRDLLTYLTWRQVKVRYAQSILGVGWAILNPLIQMIVFTIIFGNLAQISSDGAPYALFSYVALVPWTYFANGIMESSRTMISSADMISKVYFPRLIMPLSVALNQLVDFFIALILVMILMLIYQSTPGIGLLFLPILIFIMITCTIGIGMIVGAMSIQYRDVAYGLSLGTRLLMYAAPVVYPASLVPEPLRPIYALNPMAGVIEGFRSAFLQTNPMPWDLVIIGGISSIVILIIGLIYFQRREHIFADIV